MKLNKTNIATLIKRIKQWGVCRDGYELTVGYDPNTKEWDYQTGDNSYTGPCYFYPIWGVTTIFPRSKSQDLAKEVVDQILDQTEHYKTFYGIA
jgi:hypothetical protein